MNIRDTDPCGRIHNCMDCGKILPPCQLPPWLCPWINEDENQYCLDCEEKFKIEMEKFYQEGMKENEHS